MAFPLVSKLHGVAIHAKLNESGLLPTIDAYGPRCTYVPKARRQEITLPRCLIQIVPELWIGCWKVGSRPLRLSQLSIRGTPVCYFEEMCHNLGYTHQTVYGIYDERGRVDFQR